jgi:hypothetical protein
VLLRDWFNLRLTNLWVFQALAKEHEQLNVISDTQVGIPVRQQKQGADSIRFSGARSELAAALVQLTG